MASEKIKIQTKTSSGRPILVPAEIERRDGRIYFIVSPFSLKDEIKAMRGSHYHGYEPEGYCAGKKVWSVEDCQRNDFQLALMQGADMFTWFDRDLVRHAYRPLKRNGVPMEFMPHQVDMSDAGLTYHFQIWAAEMGCIDGAAEVHVNRAGKGFTTTLANLYHKFNGGGTDGGNGVRYWDLKIPTCIRSLCGDTLRLNRIVKVLDKGVRLVYKLTLVSGKCLRLTSDHEVCTGLDQYQSAASLTVGDTVLSNGGKGGLIQFLPVYDTVVSIVPDGTAHVYDVVCADPHRNFVANGIVIHNCGKTLSAQMVIENSGVNDWYWVGPKTSLPNVQREFRIWGFPAEKFDIQYYTYEGLVRVVDEWPENVLPPHGLICDEASRVKNYGSQRSKAVQRLADMIRAKWSVEGGYVIEMSGTPSPKTPVDWWSIAEIAWPGFLREGNPRAMESRLAFMVDAQYETTQFKKRIGWRDDERKCHICGAYREEGPHDPADCDEDYHAFVPSTNEVAYLHERLNGLVIVKHKKDCLGLPEKRYRQIVCKPTASTLRVAKGLLESAPNTITGLTLVRELSDGFQYREAKDGKTKCGHCTDGTVVNYRDPQDADRCYPGTDLLPDEVLARLVEERVPCPLCGGSQEVDKIVRTVREVPCPKEAALKMLLEECEETGRIVVFAGFTGSVDRICKLARQQKWSVVRCDRGNFQILPHDDAAVQEGPLDYWANMADHPRVAFVANPESGGMSLTLVESRMAVYWSNSYKPEYRVQSEDRIHRKGMDENLGCTIVDLIHLPTDRRVLDVIRANRKLELMSMGEIMDGINWNDEAAKDGEFEEYRT